MSNTSDLRTCCLAIPKLEHQPQNKIVKDFGANMLPKQCNLSP